MIKEDSASMFNSLNTLEEFIAFLGGEFNAIGTVGSILELEIEDKEKIKMLEEYVVKVKQKLSLMENSDKILFAKAFDIVRPKE